jgi:hypothetical protein
VGADMTTAVEAVFVGKERRFNRRFLAMCSHYLVEPVACTPAAGWEKGQVEPGWQCARAPVPELLRHLGRTRLLTESLDALATDDPGRARCSRESALHARLHWEMAKSLGCQHSDRVGDRRSHNRHAGFADPVVDLIVGGNHLHAPIGASGAFLRPRLSARCRLS